MWFLFKSKKEIEKERKDIAKDKVIEDIKKDALEPMIKATNDLKQLNLLVEKHGIGGVIYFSTGKGRK